ncbi:glmZ(sRNA)-inactivating NTPase [Corynebacterium aquilae DSM 44791]|uniref:GlmZ(SRNA)-inactivating NTPase n=2 Tax=Corynebacterium aquilae TaxID=203263 RepID=A0A1L7CG67_9CORY|nr:glmZ(sRNA)-inactivating NTPase [Corynebacterium aquilae DSM 44791]
MSGAGLSTAARVLEDMGWFVTQNLPPNLIVHFLQTVDHLTGPDGEPIEKLAFVSDVRSQEVLGSLAEALETLRSSGCNPTVVFMEARDDVLVRRFDTVRRTHPLQGDGSLLSGISKERVSLSQLKESADIVVDTSELSIHDLRRTLESSFATLASQRQHVTVQSFGFKHGAPQDADIVVDMRFLPNPYWVPELRGGRGVDAPVAEYVLSRPEAQNFLDSFVTMLTNMMPGYAREGKNFVTVGVGCTGGHHRSVAVAEALAKRLSSQDGLDVSVIHRDINRD